MDDIDIVISTYRADNPALDGLVVSRATCVSQRTLSTSLDLKWQLTPVMDWAPNENISHQYIYRNNLFYMVEYGKEVIMTRFRRNVGLVVRVSGIGLSLIH